MHVLDSFTLSKCLLFTTRKSRFTSYAGDNPATTSESPRRNEDRDPVDAYYVMVRSAYVMRSASDKTPQ
eukprot:2212211-Pyramimonas_sp.AAC.1